MLVKKWQYIYLLLAIVFLLSTFLNTKINATLYDIWIFDPWGGLWGFLPNLFVLNYWLIFISELSDSIFYHVVFFGNIVGWSFGGLFLKRIENLYHAKKNKNYVEFKLLKRRMFLFLFKYIVFFISLMFLLVMWLIVKTFIIL